jgi:hypothetical protein
VAEDAEREQPLTVRVDTCDADDHEVVRLTWTPGVRITGQLAREAMDLVDDLNAGRSRPLLVDMTGTAALTREARQVFTHECSASACALVGRSPVDRVLANFALGVYRMAMPTRFFTDEPAALEWLSGVESLP